jgi:hypothetical protein
MKREQKSCSCEENPKPVESSLRFLEFLSLGIAGPEMAWRFLRDLKGISDFRIFPFEVGLLLCIE